MIGKPAAARLRAALAAEGATLEQLADGRWHVRAGGRYVRVTAAAVAELEAAGHLEPRPCRPLILRTFALSAAGRALVAGGGS